MNGQSLGMIETRGFVAAVEALDAGVKAANVVSEGFRVTPSALVTVMFAGDVSAVQTAVKAGVAAARKVGEVVASHVIPRPDAQLRPALLGSGPGPGVPPIKKAPSGDSGTQPRKTDEVVGLQTDRAKPAETVSKTEPGKTHKQSPSKDKAVRPAEKPTPAPQKNRRANQKEKTQRGDKKTGA